MDIDLIFKIAAVGIIVVQRIAELFEMVKTLFEF